MVSDIDDTIKITGVHSTAQVFASTFLQPFAAVPGMSACYRALAERISGADFHYVSASPCQLYVPLQAFLDTEGFPAGSVHLRQLELNYATVASRFATPSDYKVAQIEPLLLAFPKRCFLLIGDASEHDPEAYAALARSYPRQIAGIRIRATPGYGADSPRFRSTFAGLADDLWQVFGEATDMRPPVNCAAEE